MLRAAATDIRYAAFSRFRTGVRNQSVVFSPAFMNSAASARSRCSRPRVTSLISALTVSFEATNAVGRALPVLPQGYRKRQGVVEARLCLWS